MWYCVDIESKHVGPVRPTAAIWGAGGIANTHLDALRSNGITVAAVVSRTQDGARAFAQRWGIPQWGSDPAILFAPEIDCIHICTPPNLHYEMAVTLLEQGKHVLCEKPLCFSDEQARHLAQSAPSTSMSASIPPARLPARPLRPRTLAGCC